MCRTNKTNHRASHPQPPTPESLSVALLDVKRSSECGGTRRSGHFDYLLVNTGTIPPPIHTQGLQNMHTIVLEGNHDTQLAHMLCVPGFPLVENDSRHSMHCSHLLGTKPLTPSQELRSVAPQLRAQFSEPATWTTAHTIWYEERIPIIDQDPIVNSTM